MYSHLLVPLDVSKLAERALPHAGAIARRFGARVTLLQVVSTIPIAASLDPMAAGGSDAMVAMEAMESAEKEAESYLHEITSSPEMEGVPLSVELTRGVPAPEIVRRAQKDDIDLIVMSTHGRSGLGRLVFGSVADEVLREAGIPILLIHSHESHQR